MTTPTFCPCCSTATTAFNGNGVAALLVVREGEGNNKQQATQHSPQPLSTAYITLLLFTAQLPPKDRLLDDFHISNYTRLRDYNITLISLVNMLNDGPIISSKEALDISPSPSSSQAISRQNSSNQLSSMSRQNSSCQLNSMSRQNSSNQLNNMNACQESYILFKQCSTAGEVEGFSCGNAVASYMRCAMNGYNPC